MRVLVTGSEGYIGTILCAYLLDRGHDVTGLDTGFHRVGWLYHGVDRSPSWMAKDIREVVLEDLVGFDAVVHLAELSNDPVGALNPDITFEINHHGSVRLASLAKAAGVRALHLHVLVQRLRGRRRHRQHRDIGRASLDGVRQVQGARGARRARPRERRLLADVPAQRDGLRGLAADAVRSRGQ